MSRPQSELSYRKAVWGTRPSAINAKSLDLHANYNESLASIQQQNTSTSSLQKQGTVKSLGQSVSSIPMGAQPNKSAQKPKNNKPRYIIGIGENNKNSKRFLDFFKILTGLLAVPTVIINLFL